MDCKNCGTKMGDESAFCIGCGAPMRDGMVAPLTPEQEKSVKSWSWGGFFGSWVFLLVNKQAKKGILVLVLMLAMLVTRFLPWFTHVSLGVSTIVGGVLGLAYLIISVLLGVRGRQMVWNSGVYATFDAFKKRQRTVTKAIIIYYVAYIILIVGTVMLIARAYMHNPALVDQKIMASALLDEQSKKPDVVVADFKIGYEAGAYDSASPLTNVPNGIAEKTSSYQDGYIYGYMVTCMQANANQNICLQNLAKDIGADQK